MSKKLTTRLVPLILVIALVLTFGLVLAYASPALPAASAERPAPSVEYEGKVYATMDGYELMTDPELPGHVFSYTYNPDPLSVDLPNIMQKPNFEICKLMGGGMEEPTYEWMAGDINSCDGVYYDRNDLETPLGAHSDPYYPTEVGQYRLVVTVPASETGISNETFYVDYDIVPASLTINWSNTDTLPDGADYSVYGIDPTDLTLVDTMYDYNGASDWKSAFTGPFGVYGCESQNSEDTPGIDIDYVRFAFVPSADSEWGEQIELDAASNADTYVWKAFLHSSNGKAGNYKLTNPTHTFTIRPQQIADSGNVSIPMYTEDPDGLIENNALGHDLFDFYYTGLDFADDISLYYEPDSGVMSSSLYDIITMDYDYYIAGFTWRPLGSDPSDPYTRVTTMTEVGEYNSILIGFRYKEGKDADNHDATCTDIPGNYEIEKYFDTVVRINKRPFYITWGTTEPTYNGEAQLPTYAVYYKQTAFESQAMYLGWDFNNTHYAMLPEDPTKMEIKDDEYNDVTEPIIDRALVDYTVTLTVADDCDANYVFEQGAYPFEDHATAAFNIGKEYVRYSFGPRVENDEDVALQWGQDTNSWVGVVNNNTLTYNNPFQIEYYLYEHDGNFADFPVNVEFRWKGILKSTGELDSTYQMGMVNWADYLPGTWEYFLTVTWMGVDPTNYQTSTQDGDFVVTKAKIYAEPSAPKTNVFVYDGTEKYSSAAWDFYLYAPKASESSVLLATNNGESWMMNPGGLPWGLSTDGGDVNPIFEMEAVNTANFVGAGNHTAFTTDFSTSYKIEASDLTYNDVFMSVSEQNYVAVHLTINKAPLLMTPNIDDYTYGDPSTALSITADIADEDIPAEDTGSVNTYSVTVKYNTVSADAEDGWLTLFDNVPRTNLIYGNSVTANWPTLAGTYYVRISYSWGNFYATNEEGDPGDTDRTEAAYFATSFTIAPRTVAFSYSNPGFVYDGTAKYLKTAANSGNFYINNFEAGDDLDFTVTGDGNVDANGYTLTVTGLTGADAANYVLPDVKTQSYSIGKRPITVTVDSKSSVYGSAHVELTGSVTDGSILAADAGKVYVIGTDVTAATHVGLYDIYVSAYEGEGSRAFCYAISQENKTNSYEVTKKDLTISVKTNLHVYYGTARTITLDDLDTEGWVNGDTFAQIGGEKTITCVYDTADTNQRAAGEYSIALSEFTSADYNLIITNGKLYVDPKPITVSINNQTSVYGAADWAALTHVALTGDNTTAFGDTAPFTLGVWEIYYDEMDEKYQGRTKAGAAANPVGTYFIVGTPTGNPNYDVTFAAADYTTSAEDSHGVWDGTVGKYTIAPKVLTPIWTLNGTGEEGAYTYSGAIQSFPSAAAEGVAGDGTINFTVTEQSSKTFKDADDYSFIATSANANYEVRTAGDVNVKAVSIAKATLTFTWTGTNLVYNGTEQKPTFDSVSGVLGNDLFQAGEDSDALYYAWNGGVTYCGTWSDLTFRLTGARADNYAIANNTVNFTINRMPLVFTWTGDADETPFEFVYEEDTPRALGVSTSSMVANGKYGGAMDELALTVTYYAASDTSFTSPLAGAPTNKGSYVAKVTFANTQANIDLDRDIADNYTLDGSTSATQAFSVGTKTIAVVWPEVIPTWTYNGTVQSAATYQIASATDGETPIAVTVSIQGGADFKDAGNYILVATTSDPNYALSNNTYGVSIGKATVTVNAWYIDGVEKTDGAKVTYARHDYVVTAAFAGVMDGETLTPVVVNDTKINSGEYTSTVAMSLNLTATGAATANYKLLADATFSWEIEKRTLELAWYFDGALVDFEDELSVTYDGSEHTLVPDPTTNVCEGDHVALAYTQNHCAGTNAYDYEVRINSDTFYGENDNYRINPYQASKAWSINRVTLTAGDFYAKVWCDEKLMESGYTFAAVDGGKTLSAVYCGNQYVLQIRAHGVNEEDILVKANYYTNAGSSTTNINGMTFMADGADQGVYNYAGFDFDLTCAVTRRPVSVVWSLDNAVASSGATVAYDGLAHEVTVAYDNLVNAGDLNAYNDIATEDDLSQRNYQEGGFTYSIAAFESGNYTLVSDSIFTWSITKKTIAVTFDWETANIPSVTYGDTDAWFALGERMEANDYYFTANVDLGTGDTFTGDNRLLNVWLEPLEGGDPIIPDDETAVGTYVLKAELAGNTNYTVTALVIDGEHNKLVVTKADFIAHHVTQTTNLVYTGKGQVATVNAYAETVNDMDPTFSYRLSDKDEWKDTVPDVTDAKKYSVFYKVVADNHNDAFGTLYVTIGEKALEAAIDVKGVTYGTALTKPTFANGGIVTTGWVKGEENTLSALDEEALAAYLTVYYFPKGDYADFNEFQMAFFMQFESEEEMEAALPKYQALPTQAGTYFVLLLVEGVKNYSPAMDVKEVTIAKKALNVKFDNASTTYGDAFAFGGNVVSYKGFADGEDATVLGGTLGFTTAYTVASGVGMYDVTPNGLTSGNYDITFETGRLQVDAAMLTVAINVNNGVYGTAVKAPVIGDGITVTGWKNGQSADMIKSNNVLLYYFLKDGTLNETKAKLEAAINELEEEEAEAYLASLATMPTAAGTYYAWINIVGIANYAVNPVSTEFTIAKKALTVTFENNSTTYGEAFVLDGDVLTFEGFAYEDDAKALGGKLGFATTYTAASVVGEYDVTPNGLTSGNYAITFVGGTLVVEKADLFLNAEVADVTYGTPVVPDWTVEDWVNGDTPLLLLEKDVLTIGYAPIKYADGGDEFLADIADLDVLDGVPTEAGEYIFFVVIENLANYGSQSLETTFTIAKKAVKVTAENKESFFEEDLATLTATNTGIVGEDKVYTLTTTADKNAIGTYPITVVSANNANYVLTTENATYTVKAKAGKVETNEAGEKVVEQKETISEEAAKSEAGVSIKNMIQNVIAAAADAPVATLEIEIGTTATVTFDKAALQKLATAEDVKIVYTETKKADIDAAKKELKNAEFVIEVTLKGATFDGGKAVITASFENKAPGGKKAVVYYVDENGKKTDMNAVFENGTLSFETTHFSTYVVEYVLTGGSIAGIVIGCVVGVAAIAVAVFFLLKKKKGGDNKADEAKAEETAADKAEEAPKAEEAAEAPAATEEAAPAEEVTEAPAEEAAPEAPAEEAAPAAKPVAKKGGKKGKK